LSNRTRSFLNGCFSFVQAALPAHCVLCGSRSSQRRLCAACAKSLPRLPRARCATCALPLASGETCGDCLTRLPRYDRVLAAYPYAFPVDALVQAYKYGRDLSLAQVLAADLVRDIDECVDAIVPMPLAAARLSERGFNQAQELARCVGRALNVPVLSAACRKVSERAPQASLPFRERARNIRGAFVCDAALRGMRVAIVDDVMTTGATVNELARNLKRAGAVRVSVWVVARTLR
jgi:ComF family protein